MRFDTLLLLASDTAVVYLAVWHEWLLYHGRAKLLEFAETHTDADGSEFSFENEKGRRAAMRAYLASQKRGNGPK